MPPSSNSKTLIWLDTILCDAESDPAVLDRYFRRFKQALRALGQQQLPQGVDVKFIINLSRDKINYFALIEHELKKMPPHIAQGARIHLYDHPSEGYKVPKKAHIDQIKNPNKQPGRRDRLFRDACAETNFSPYDAVIRISMDDDDIFFPGHLVQIYETSKCLLENNPGSVSAAGFYRSYLVHVDDDKVTVDDVEFNRVIPGNKFYVCPKSQYSRLDSLSPWSIPETIDVEAVENFKAASVHLALVRNNAPTFAYMRRAKNLSGQSKAGYTDTNYSQTTFIDETEFLDKVLGAPAPPTLHEIVDKPLSRVFRISCRRPASAPDQIHVSTNFSKVFDGKCSLAFYLLDGQNRLDVRWYSTSDTAVFHNAARNLTVRAFVKRDGKIIFRAASSRIRE